MSLLTASNLGKQFSGVPALSGVSFELRPGEVHALVGENGRGEEHVVPDSLWLWAER